MKVGVVAVVLFALAGCAFTRGYADERKVEETGGVIALSGARDMALQRAAEIMAERCRGPYRVVSQEDVVLGASPLAWAGGSSPTESRVTYVCGATAPTTAKVPASAPVK